MKNDILKKAFELAYEEKAAAYRAVSVPRPTQEFLRKTEHLAAKYKSRYVKVHSVYVRKAVAMAAMLALAFSMSLSVEAVREKIKTFVIEVFQEGSNLFFKNETDENAPSCIEEYYAPVVPEGYEIVKEIKDSVKYSVRYRNLSGIEINYSQAILDGNTMANTEDVQSETFEVNGYEAIFVQRDKVLFLIWRDAKYKYKLWVSSDKFTKSDIVDLAKTLKLQK